MNTTAFTCVSLLGALSAQGVVIAALATRADPAPTPSTDASVGRCIQGHRVLWHETRAEAAEACLADLDRVGERQFSRVWHSFETEGGLW